MIQTLRPLINIHGVKKKKGIVVRAPFSENLKKTSPFAEFRELVPV